MNSKALLRRTGLAIASAALCVAALAGTAFASDTGTSDIYIQADDSQISWTVPVAVHITVNNDGTFNTPTNGKFINNSVFDIHVSSIAVATSGGASIAAYDSVGTTADTIGFQVKPGEGAYDDMSSYTTAKAPTVAGSWNISKNAGELATAYKGKIGAFGTIQPSSDTKVLTITWTAAAGTAA